MAERDSAVVDALTRVGAPFELTDIVVGGVPMRGMRRAEAGLASLFDSFDRFADRPFVVADDLRLSFAEVASAAARLAGVLVERGVRPGDRVALAGANSAAWMIGFVATVAAGAIPALVNSRGTAADMAHAIALVEAKLVLADAKRATMLAPFGFDCLVPEIDVSPGAPPLPRPGAAPGDPAMILFTSGTTGRAKGATLSHRAALTGLLLAQMAGAMIAIRMFGADALTMPRPQQATLMAFPLFHVSGCHATFLSALASGNRLVMAPKWEPDAIVRLIEREGVTAVSGSPAMIWDLIAAKERAGATLETLTSVSTGGQAQPVNLLDAVVAAFPRAIVGTGFGATETAGAIAMHTGSDYLANPRAAGRVLPLAEVRIRDAEGRDLPVGEAGEIVVRGPMVTSGYWNDRPASDRALKDGWLRTGDVGALDAAGNLTILDRLTDMVISGGENIYCAEVEAAIQQNPGIVEAAAYGVPDERLGERLVAVVRGQGPVDLDALAAHLRGTLADYRRPTEIRVTQEGLPRNVLGKVDKRALRAAHEQGEGADAAA
ncbi:class I adenylate-forming enzyme family protein [Sphingomonas jatrophae]|uniref:Acyl-CoA synthetase (AMP-forming)/AMP-acid ligase II n=1 Tax=Sphingomonas jatrophae TaxID=1166337 RepID=A0A1I6KJR0_9SPHN|nr:AMP-binding protein [Sphingomonas jatrophae]SFR91394.1 Acyl-CoA synthetase (AMP-forming)/AMP-acid ligase II [Sphingomonas jatrophae]